MRIPNVRYLTIDTIGMIKIKLLYLQNTNVRSAKKYIFFNLIIIFSVLITLVSLKMKYIKNINCRSYSYKNIFTYT